MKVSERGTRFIMEIQGLLGARNTPYHDLAGVKRIGFGHPIRMGEIHKYANGITMKQAESFLCDDLIVVAADVEQACFGRVKIKQHQFDALCSLVHCLSPTEWNNSIIKRALLHRAPVSVPDGFMEWVYIAEDCKLRRKQLLVKARQAERELFEKGIYDK